MPNSPEYTICNDSDNDTFEQVVAARLSRRNFLSGTLSTAAVASLGGVGALLSAVPTAAKKPEGLLLGFTGIDVSSDDTVVVPPGYTARVLIAWGDPVSAGLASAPNASNTAAEQAMQWGMHNDGMVYFKINGSARASRTEQRIHRRRAAVFGRRDELESGEDEQVFERTHGVSIIEISKQGKGEGKGGEWRVVRPSPYARRITGRTPILMGGPLAQPGQSTADSRLITSADPTGRSVLGTINNCAMGFTPWKTYLAPLWHHCRGCRIPLASHRQSVSRQRRAQ
jgi:secreted PhoX family phosphatase